MGCSSKIQDIGNIPYIEKLYEDYTEPSGESFEVILYFLLWKSRDEICSFLKKKQDIMNKNETRSLEQILLLTKIKEIKNYGFEYDRNFLFYLYSNKGVIITKNYKKINYFLSNYIKDLIKICFVDYSEIYKGNNIYFGFHEIKEQSRYFFELNNKEINFIYRNQLINDAKDEELSDLEINENDDSFSESDSYVKTNNNFKKVKNYKIEYVDDDDDDYNGAKNIMGDKINLIKNRVKNENLYSNINNSLNNTINDNLINNVNSNVNNSINNIDNINNHSNKMFHINEHLNNNNLLNNQNKDINQGKIFINNLRTSRTLNENKINQENENNNLIYMINYKKINNNKIKRKKAFNNDKIFDINNNSMKINNIEDKINLNLSKKKIYSNKSTKNINIKKINNIQTQGNINEMEIDNNDNIDIIENDNKENSIEYDEDKSSLYEDGVKKPYKIYNKDTLIITTDKLTEESNIDLEKLFFDIIKNKSLQRPLDHIDYNAENSEDEIDKKRDKDEDKDYILIYKKNKISYTEIKSLTDIKKIIFRKCNFTNDNIYYLKELIMMLSSYKNLLKIEVHKNNSLKNFHGWKYLASLCKNNFYVRWIDFAGAGLSQDLINKLLDSLYKKRIRILNLSKNNLSNDIMYNLNKFLLNNQTITNLNISDNSYINTSGLKMAIAGLKSHPNIQKLNLSNIHLNKSGELISDLLNENKKITKLKIRNCDLNQKDIELISIEISKNDCSLKYLDIGQNKNIGDKGLEMIGKFILYNRTLKHLGLDDLNININNYLPIFQSIYKNRNIESYSFDMNKDMPLKGLLNFLMKNPQIKKISFYPWDRKKEPKKVFPREQISMIQLFHFKCPNMIIKGFDLRQRKALNFNK